MQKSDLLTDKNTMRDRNIFPNLSKAFLKRQLSSDKLIEVIRKKDCKRWGYMDEKKKGRFFAMPVEFLLRIEKINLGFARDVAGVLTDMWYTRGRPVDGVIWTSYYEITKILGLKTGGFTDKNILEALDLLVGYTVLNQEIITKVCPKTNKALDVRRGSFHFFENHQREIKRDGRDIPGNYQRLRIKLSEVLVNILKICIPCKISIDLLQTVGKLPKREIKAVKNLLYYFASRQINKRVEIKLSFERLKLIIESKETRKERLILRIRKYFEFLIPTLIKSFMIIKNSNGEDIYIINLQPGGKRKEVPVIYDNSIVAIEEPQQIVEEIGEEK